MTSVARPSSARFVELDPLVLYRILALRAQVFVVEQRCAYLDPDGRDVEPHTVHWWIADGADVMATARWLDDGDAGRVGRVASAAPARSAGLAGRLVEAVLGASDGPVVIDAQTPLVGWYARFGFAMSGGEFVEDGIPHVPMRLERPGPPRHR